VNVNEDSNFWFEEIREGFLDGVGLFR